MTSKKHYGWLPFVILLILLLCSSLTTSCGGGFSRGCGCNDDDDDDDDNDDSVDDDDDNDDSGDDDDTPPPEITVVPSDGATDVPLYTSVSVSSTFAFNPTTFDFSLTDGITTREGMAQFTTDNKTFYFYPYDLLDVDTAYEVHFTYEDNPYKTDFSTVVSIPDITLPGNAEAASGTAFGFRPVLDEVLYPAAINDLLMGVMEELDLLMAPVFVDLQSPTLGALNLAGGEAIDFNTDGNLELNHGATGFHSLGVIAGDTFSFTGPFTLNVRGVPLTIDDFSLSGSFGEDTLGNPTISEGYAAVTMTDCPALADAFEWFAWAVDIICDEETGLFVYAAFHGDYNPIADLIFDPPVASSDTITATFDPPLYSNYNEIMDLNAQFQILTDGQVVLDSYNATDVVTFPDCCIEEGPDWWSFSAATYNIPAADALDPGNYMLRFSMGLYGVQAEIVVE